MFKNCYKIFPYSIILFEKNLENSKTIENAINIIYNEFDNSQYFSNKIEKNILKDKNLKYFKIKFENKKNLTFENKFLLNKFIEFICLKHPEFKQYFENKNITLCSCFFKIEKFKNL